MKEYYEKKLRQTMLLRHYLIEMASIELDRISVAARKGDITPEEFQLTLSDLADISKDINDKVDYYEESIAKEITKAENGVKYSVGDEVFIKEELKIDRLSATHTVTDIVTDKKAGVGYKLDNGHTYAAHELSRTPF